MIKIQICHPFGNPNASQACKAFTSPPFQVRVISSLDVKINYQSKLVRILQKIPLCRKGLSELERRNWIPKGVEYVQLFPCPEIIRQLLLKSSLIARNSQANRKLTDWVMKSVDRVSRESVRNIENLSAVYGYEDASLQMFRSAHQRGIPRFYELPTAHHTKIRQIYSEERALFPQYAQFISSAPDIKHRLAQKDEELALASHIIVPSGFVKSSLIEAGYKSSEISVVPYGCSVNMGKREPQRDSNFKVFYAGRLSLAKGVHYLLDAWKKANLPHSTLTLAGGYYLPPSFKNYFVGNVRYVGHLNRQDLNREYLNSNLFVFPSLLEGMALVVLEAMASGLPVILTENSGYEGVIGENVEGFTVPIRNVDKIAEKLIWAFENRKILMEMGDASRKRAEKLSWEAYRKNLNQLIQRKLY